MSKVIPIPRLVIRRGVSADRQPVVALVEEVWRDTYGSHLPPEWPQYQDRNFFSELAGNPTELGWVAKLGDRVVGYGRVTSNCIDQLWVSARMRRRGIASALLDSMLASIRERGFGFAQAGCEDFNLPARRFLEARGWELIHVEPQPLGAGHAVGTLVHAIALR